MNSSLPIACAVLFTVASPSHDIHAQQYWIPLNSPTGVTLTKMSFIDTLSGWVVGDEGTILKTMDGGGHWTFQPSGVTERLVDIFMLNAYHGWALAHDLSGIGGFFGTIILSTTDGGTSWARKAYNEPEKFFRSVFFLNPLEGWMGGELGALVRTTDGGDRWDQAEIDSVPFRNFAIRKVRFHSPDFGIAVGGIRDIAGVIWRTTNGGAFWTVRGIGPEPLLDIHYHDALHITTVGGDFEFGASIVTSTDGGATWGYYSPNIYGPAEAIAFRNANEAWAPLGYTGKIMYTLDGGETWIEMFAPDSSAMYDATFIDDQTGFMIGASGKILKYNPKIVNTPTLGGPETDRSFHLFQNYPNPFNPATTLTYHLNERSLTSLRIYDLLGRLVATLWSGVQDNGTHRFTFSGEGLASGPYLYRLEMQPVHHPEERSHLTRKMILAK